MIRDEKKMVLESLFADRIESRPADMLLLSMIVSFASLMLAFLVFPEYGGIVFPLLVTVGMAPVFYKILAREEEIEEEQAEGKIKESFLQRHDNTIFLFSLFFLGVFAATFFAYLMLPEEQALSFFSAQIDSISFSKSISGNALSPGLLETIMLNNVKIILFAFVLSLFLSTGAIWILGWNASVLGIYLADFLKKGMIAEFASSSIGIFPHAFLEITGYFLAGIAGGMLSAGIIREKLSSREFRLVLMDSLLLLGLAVFLIGIGALIEAYA